MTSALAFSIGSEPLRQQRPKQSPRHTIKSLHPVAPPVAEETSERGRAMSSQQSHRTLKERLAGALRRRVGIGKAITPKQLAYTLQLSMGTIDNLMAGNNVPSARALMALLTFFDAAFANEILEPTGITVAKLSDARAAALRKVAEGMAELKAMDGAA